MRRVPVLLPYPFPGPFDYRVPPELRSAARRFVLVPLNRREELGVVWDAAGPGHEAGASRMTCGPRPQAEAADQSGRARQRRRCARGLRRLVDWIAAYTLAPPGEVMAMALRVNRAAPGPATGWRLADPLPEARLTDARRRVLEALRRRQPRATADLARAAGVSAGVVRGMADAGLLVPAPLPAAAPFAIPDPDHPGRVLSPDQEAAAAILRQAVAARAFSVTLLDGVTGSGKTEVYLEAVAECLRQRRQALVLLPEIALSSQWLERFERRFGVAPAVWHSDLTSRVRRTTWRAVAEGAAPVVVGARSALFLPFPDLGLVVVDEEHETAFKQEEGVVYHARDMAVVRARFCAAPAVLVSATPSLETVANVEAGRYAPHHPADAARRRGAAGDRGDRPARDAAGARALPGAAADRGGARHPGARRAGDAVPQPPGLRAADAVPALRPPHAVPELHRLAGGAPRAPASCNATIAATRCRSRPNARPAARRTA